MITLKDIIGQLVILSSKPIVAVHDQNNGNYINPLAMGQLPTLSSRQSLSMIVERETVFIQVNTTLVNSK